MKFHAITNIEINDYYKHNKHYGGCFSKDELKGKIQNKFYIVNMQNHTGGGSHWVLIFNCNPKVCLYIDSFGVVPPVEIERFMSTQRKPWQYSTLELQNIQSILCGYYCCFLANMLLQGKSLKQIADMFSTDTLQNDELIMSYFGHEHTFVGGSLLGKLFNKLPNFVKNRIHYKPKEDATNRFKEFLDKEGSQNIESLRFGREPVVGGVQKFLNVISFGKYEKKKKELGYDDVYHNYLVATLKDGRTVRLEKNHVVEAKPAKKGDGQYEIPLNNPNLNIKELISTAEKGDPSFFSYNATSNNCQKFVNEIIQKNKLEPTDQNTINALKPQDGVALINTLPGPIRGIHKLATDVAAVGDHILHGGKVKKRKSK